MIDTMAESYVQRRVRSVLLGGWFTQQALRYCGKDYGSERVNQYRFYRTVYRMGAVEAWHHVAKFEQAFQGTERWVEANELGKDSG
jgi:hypothetical protein